MTQEKEQNLKNHAKTVPIFHMFVLPVFLINIIWSLVRLRYGLTFGAILSVLMSVALMVLALCARTFALKVQGCCRRSFTRASGSSQWRN